jgi:hypothetical protein
MRGLIEGGDEIGIAKAARSAQAEVAEAPVSLPLQSQACIRLPEQIHLCGYGLLRMLSELHRREPRAALLFYSQKEPLI